MGWHHGQKYKDPWRLSARHSCDARDKASNCPGLSLLCKRRGVDTGLHLPLLLVSDGFENLMKAMGPSTLRENTPQYIHRTFYAQLQGLIPLPLMPTHGPSEGVGGYVSSLVLQDLVSMIFCWAVST